MTIKTDAHQWQVLYVGSDGGTDFYGVCKVAEGKVRVVSSWFADVSRANELAREWGERDGVQWFGR